MQYAKMWKLMRKSYYLRLRYVVMEAESKHYLIDIDSPSFRWGYICPIIHWIVPHRVHEIHLSSSELSRSFLNKDLEEDRRDRRKMKVKDWIMLVFLIIIFRSIDSSILMYSYLSLFMSYFLLLLGMFLLVGLKIIVSKKNKKVLKMIGGDNLSEVKISLVPDSPFEMLKIIFSFVVVILTTLFGFMLFSTIGSDPGTGNLWLGYGIGAFFFTMYLFINILIIRSFNYRVKIRQIRMKENNEH